MLCGYERKQRRNLKILGPKEARNTACQKQWVKQKEILKAASAVIWIHLNRPGCGDTCP